MALKYGPVNAELRESLKLFGVKPLWPNSIRGNSKAVRSGSTEKAVLDAVIDKLPGKSGASLVAITHWPDGAWKKTFESSDWTLEIPEALMREEYLARAKIAEAELLKS